MKAHRFVADRHRRAYVLVRRERGTRPPVSGK